MKPLDACYRAAAARPWSEYLLAPRYQAADERGATETPAGLPLNRPIPVLTTAIPPLITLAVTANALHMLQFLAADQPAFWSELVNKLDSASAGSLHRLKLALQVQSSLQHVALDEWTPYIYEQAADELEAFDPDAEPDPSLIHHAHEAGRWTAIAIKNIDTRDAHTLQSIAHALTSLLAVCVFADIATERA